MEYIGTIKVVPKLPDEIKRLAELARNLYFSWTPEARQSFRLIDPELWTRVNHNPIKFLEEVQQKQLEKCASDPVYLSYFKKVMVEFDQYLSADQTWFKQTYPKARNSVFAYFSAELGFHESLPIYSGGLGVLAGDHLKAASDLGLPIVAVSLFYHQTYFTQQIDAHGNQIALYIPHLPEELPLHPVLKEDGHPLLVSVTVGTKDVQVKIWRAQVGRIMAFFLDTNLPQNSPEDRLITSRLYGGEEEMRISQEIVLGMGGVRALTAMGIEPSVWHMNEGHSVFLALERLRLLIKKKGLSFSHAMEVVAANTIFTTHTPVPAGNDAFPLHFVDKYFQRYWESIGIRRYQFMELGSQIQPEGYEIFNLTILALKLSRFRNGVSKLHGEVSRNMWRDVWSNIPANEVPIKHITNGVHFNTWTVYVMRQLFEKHLGKQLESHLDDPVFWKGVFGIPDEELWETKMSVKEKMLNHLRERLYIQNVRNKTGTLQLSRLHAMLQPDVLTIGFARRFATYKRGTLIFRDKERLKALLNNPDRPVQLIFCGKAHPKDQGGQTLIRSINEIAMEEGFRGRVFFVENYDMSLARDLVSGVDVWLNNPRRPQEASGTSGQKAGMNGGINFSVLDGWWAEGYNGQNGFAFGDREDYSDLEELDSWDSEAIYDILENDLIPLYYARNANGLSTEWIKMMKHSIASVAPVYNTYRMVKDYVNMLYMPALKNGADFAMNDFAVSKEYSQWRQHLEANWSHVRLELDKGSNASAEFQLQFGEPVKLRVIARLGTIDPAHVKVQVYLVNDFKDSLESSSSELVEMSRKKKIEDGVYLYEAVLQPSNSGYYNYTARVIPNHPRLLTDTEVGLVRWLHSQEQ